MKIRHIVLINICCLVVVFSSSCMGMQPTRLTQEDCLPPLFDFAFPYKEEGVTEIKQDSPSNASITPQVDDKGMPITVNEGDLVVRSDDEVWLIEPLMRYTPSTKEIKEYVILDNAGYPIYPGSLFLDSEETLYIMAVNKTFDGIIFARYNDQTDLFEIIKPASNPLLGSHINPGHNIVEDQDGIFWFVSIDSISGQLNSLYSYLIRFNPINGLTERVLGKEQGYIPSDALVMYSDNSIWLAAQKIEAVKNGEIYRLDHQIIRFDIKTGAIKEFGSPSIERSIVELFIDHQDHLWFDDYGYLELTGDSAGTWYQVIRSPIFITDRSGNYQYVWKRPDPEVETHERFLWFTFSGLARLDLDTNEWCLITRMPVYNIAKDSQDNLWFVSDKQLFKFEFQP